MQLDFFPSRTLTLYLAKLFIARILAVLVMLVLVLMMLDLLSTSGDILAVEGNGQAELLRYAGLRIPQLIESFLPYSVLLATLILLVGLNQNSEVVAMKAAGLSAHQVLAPLVLTAALIACVSFAFNERIVTRATTSLKSWEASEYGLIPEANDERGNIFLTDGTHVLSASALTGTGEAIVMQNVTWYERSQQGIILNQIRAPSATYAGPGWQLQDAVKFEVQTAGNSALESVVVGQGISPAQVDLASVDPDTQGFFELANSIDRYESVGRRTDELRAKWWHKLASPLSSLLMPLLGSIAAFGLARSGQLLIRAIAGMGLGFAYFVVDNASLAMGSFGGYPPFLAAWAPFILFFFIGETVLIRTEE
jgi:lipopolysaccharide export system permease protein